MLGVHVGDLRVLVAHQLIMGELWGYKCGSPIGVPHELRVILRRWWYVCVPCRVERRELGPGNVYRFWVIPVRLVMNGVWRRVRPVERVLAVGGDEVTVVVVAGLVAEKGVVVVGPLVEKLVDEVA